MAWQMTTATARIAATVATLLTALTVMLLANLPAIALAAGTAPGRVTFVHGDNVWSPGWLFNNSDDWLALSCTGEECRLVPAVLRVTPKSWQGHYDDVPTTGQQLGFRTTTDVPGTVYAWIRHDDTAPWLTPGAVELYFASGLTPVLQVRKDTYEIDITTAGGARENIGPVLIVDEGREEGSPAQLSGGSVHLRLKARGTQQLLPDRVTECSGQLGNEYLLWAGDLDRDGKTDYLLDYTDFATGSVKLFLSSYAAPGMLLGEAGAAITHPLESDCI